ncbi:hypothetical protein ACFC5Z_13785 [Streptomyces sp. NPDC056004]|uniref:hypothetical protein n=1 Tax=Streptomyces sp. NPDC056004 TaxID=3345677 RepID=UPI0035D65CAF
MAHPLTSPHHNPTRTFPQVRTGIRCGPAAHLLGALVLFACLHIRRPRRLRHLRRLAAPVATVTCLPGPLLAAPHSAMVPPGLPDGFQPATTPTPAPTDPAAADPAELQVRAWLHHDQHGDIDAVTSRDEAGARR